MSKVPLNESLAISKRLKNCKQDIEDFMTGITNNMTIDFDELCQYINIEPSHITIKCVEGHTGSDLEDTESGMEVTKREKLIQFNISLEVTAGLLEFLATAFRMIDDTKIISLCFVDNGMNTEQLELLRPFQERFAGKLYSIYVHHVVGFRNTVNPAISGTDGPTNDSEFPDFLHIVGWEDVRIVSFKNDRLNDNDCTAICQILQKSQGGGLSVLMMDFNEISSRGFLELLGHILEKVSSIMVLSFSYNAITDDALDGLQAIIEKRGLGNLQSLRIMFNRFTDGKKENFERFVRNQEIKCNVCL